MIYVINFFDENGNVIADCTTENVVDTRLIDDRDIRLFTTSYSSYLTNRVSLEKNPTQEMALTAIHNANKFYKFIEKYKDYKYTITKQETIK